MIEAGSGCTYVGWVAAWHEKRNYCGQSFRIVLQSRLGIGGNGHTLDDLLPKCDRSQGTAEIADGKFVGRLVFDDVQEGAGPILFLIVAILIWNVAFLAGIGC